jgi:protein-disulfide isomerase
MLLLPSRRPSAARRSPASRASSPRSIRLAGILAIAVAGTGLLGACGGGGNDVPRDPAPAPGGAAAAAEAPSSSTDSVLVRADRARVQGAPDAPVWMVVVSDFECPYCARWHAQSYDTLKRAYVDSGKIRIAYLNYPLPNHPHAWPAAEAAMCAGLQGKFWEMHDAIFETQDRWRPMSVTDAAPLFDSLAVARDLDMAAHRRCLSTHQLRPLIQADFDRVQRAGVTGTPAFFIGKEVIAGLGPTSAYAAAIDSALAQAAAGGAARP